MKRSILWGFPRKRMLFYFWIGLLCSLPSFGVTSKFNSNLLLAQDQLYRLKFKEANTLLSSEIKHHPENVSAYYLQETLSFIRAFISETDADYSLHDKAMNLAWPHIEKLGQQDIYRHFFLSEMGLHKGLLQLKSGNYTSAALEFKEAYKQAGVSTRLHPDFLPAYKNLAILEAASANLSPSYKWLLQMAGINTNYQKSLNISLDFIQNNKKNELEWMRKETAYLTAYILWHIREEAQAWKIIQQHTSDYKQNPLALYFYTVFAHKKRLNDDCLLKLESYTPAKSSYKIPYLFYLKGLCQLQKLDTGCLQSFHYFRSIHRGKHYIKASHLKTAWAYLVFGKKHAYSREIENVKTSGIAISEEDKQALTEANRTMIPNVILLKSRLLFDGGYLQPSLNLILPYKASDFKTVMEQTEYCYRKGRIYHSLQQTELAIAFYEAAISTGKNVNAYYAAYACLYLAEVYASTGNSKNALEYYKKATTFSRNTEYVKSIEHKASIGIRKLK